MVSPLVGAIPVIPRHAKHVSNLQLDLSVMQSLVREYRLLLMFILSAVIPDVIKRLELVTGIGMILLHYLVSYSANLTTKCADKMIGQGEQVDVLDDAPQGAVRVSGAHGCTPSNVL